MDHPFVRHVPERSRKEELLNWITHGTGLLLSLAGVPILLVLAVAGDKPVEVITGCSIFGGTLVLMYAASTLYHGLWAFSLKRVLRILDHVAIYLFIAGTYTPFVLLYFDGPWSYVLLILEWGIALVGVLFKLFFIGRFPRFSVGVYLAMGWMVVLAVEPLITSVPPGCLALMLGGGLLYTGGVVFFAWESLPYNHAIWHIFVLGGSLCHYLALVLYL